MTLQCTHPDHSDIPNLQPTPSEEPVQILMNVVVTSSYIPVSWSTNSSLMIADDCWRSLMIVDDSWWLLMIVDDRWWSSLIADDRWQSLMIVDDRWWSLMIVDDRWWSLANVGKCWQMLATLPLPRVFGRQCLCSMGSFKMRWTPAMSSNCPDLIPGPNLRTWSRYPQFCWIKG